MTFQHDAMHFVAIIGLLFLGWSWVRMARDFSVGVARFDWQWTTALFRGARDTAGYDRSLDPSRFWWCTGLKIVLYSALTFGFLILLLES
jgi:hypothetical protein